MEIKQTETGQGDRTSQPERSSATRAKLLSVARVLFAHRGYAGVGTEQIVRAAGVTRGALYHHFAGKRELFEAVHEQIEAEIVERIAAQAAAASPVDSDPLQALRVGTQAFLDVCEDAAIQRIALLDAPSVLGWERWREIGLEHVFGLVHGALQAAIDAGGIERQPVEPLAHLLLGASHEGAMLVARADDDGRTRRQVGEAIDRFLDALRPLGESASG